MFAFKLKPVSAEFLAPMMEIPAEREIDPDVTYYALVDIDQTVTILSEEELRQREAAEGEEFIIFQ